MRNSFYSGKIMGHYSGGSDDRDDRKSYVRVPKMSLMIYLMESANYSPDFFMDRLEEIISQRSTYQLLRLENFIKGRLYGSTALPRNIK